jgi:predicted RNA-binding protein with TRAM domain
MIVSDMMEEKTESTNSAQSRNISKSRSTTEDELEELKKLIVENERLIQKYPEKISLRIGLESLVTSKKKLELLREKTPIVADGKKSYTESHSVPVVEGETYDVTIQDIARQGDGIARIEGFVVFVPNTRVGDEVQIKVGRVLPKFAFANINE